MDGTYRCSREEGAQGIRGDRFAHFSNSQRGNSSGDDIDRSVGSAETNRAGLENPTAYSELRPAIKALIEILHHKPAAYGINRSNWTQESLAEAFEKLYGQRPSKSTVSRLLKQAVSLEKSRKVLTSPDPNYREKVRVVIENPAVFES